MTTRSFRFSGPRWNHSENWQNRILVQRVAGPVRFHYNSAHRTLLIHHAEQTVPRLKTKWNRGEDARSFEETASVLGANIWRIATECLLNLENENFETRSNAQRLDTISEFAAFAIHLLDRHAYTRLDDAGRTALVTATAQRFGEIIQDNHMDTDGGGEDYRRRFIDLVNRRADEYAGCRCSNEEGPDFSMRRLCGEYVRDAMGERYKKWIPDYVMDVEAPGLYKNMRRAVAAMF